MAALTLALIFAALAACAGGSSPHPSPHPTVTTPISTPYRLLYRQFGREKDTIWRVAPSSPGQPEEVAFIPHRAEWGIIPSLSPDGKLLAYTTFPDGALDESFHSEAHILNLETGKTDLVAQGVDLRQRPFWSPDGERLFLRRNTEQEVAILQVDLTRGEEEPGRLRVILQAPASEVLTFIPLGFASDERSLYLVEVLGGAGGTQVVAYSLVDDGGPGSTPGQTTFVARLSEKEIARDFDLSPDSRRVVSLAQEAVEGRLVFRTFVADLVGKSVTPLSAKGLGAGDHLRPLWHPDGTRIAVGQLPLGGEPTAVALVPLTGGELSFLPAPAAGFDVPSTWAPDGSFLALTSFEGGSGASPGKARLVLAAPSGQRLVVAEGADIEAIGWAKK